MDDDAAEVLASYDDVDLELVGLTSLSHLAALALTNQKNGSLNLSGLTSLADDIAEVFSSYNGYLCFDGLESLSDVGAVALAKSAGSLYLSGLTSVTNSVAAALIRHEGPVTLDGLTTLTHAGLAAKLAEQDDELNLPGLTVLSNEVATALSKTKAKLFLGNVKSIPNFDLAWKLFLQTPNDDFLSSITAISQAEASIISKYKGDVYLENLTLISDIDAETLSQHQGVLGLRGLTSLTDRSAEMLSKHKGIVILPQSLAKQVGGHFLERFSKGVTQTASATTADGKIRAVDLEQGKLYDCKVYGESGPEDCCIVQLAIDATSNRRLVLSQARYIYQKDPEFVRGLISWEFFLLSTESSGNAKWQKSIYEMQLDETGDTLTFGDDGDCYYDFIETDVIKA